MPSLLGFDIGLIRYLAGEEGRGGMGGLRFVMDHACCGAVMAGVHV